MTDGVADLLFQLLSAVHQASDVHAIADAIKAEGGKPTLPSARERLVTGSMDTVARLLQQ